MPNEYDPLPSSPDPDFTTGERSRGGCLTLFLVLAMIANPIVGISYVFGGAAIAGQLGGGAWAMPVLAVIAFANLAFAIGAWNWKRWGVYGLVGSAVVTLGINLALGLGVTQVISGAIGPAILIALVNSRWDSFE